MKIICIEVSNTIRKIIANIVINLKQDYTSVATGKALLTACRKDKYEIVIMGYELTDYKAEKLINKLRKYIEYSDVLVWVLSSQDLSNVESINMPFVKFFKKENIPYIHHELSKQLGTFPDFHPFSTQKILLVDDSTVSRMIALRSLTSLGAKVEQASDGKEALAMMLENSYSLVLMDCEMPFMSGLESAVAYRKLQPLSDLIIIALSGHSAEYKKTIIDAGMNYLITKPIEGHKIMHALEVLAYNKP